MFLSYSILGPSSCIWNSASALILFPWIPLKLESARAVPRANDIVNYMVDTWKRGLIIGMALLFLCLSLYSVKLLNSFMWRGFARILTESRWLRASKFIVHKLTQVSEGIQASTIPFQILLLGSNMHGVNHLCTGLVDSSPKGVHWMETNESKQTLFLKQCSVITGRVCLWIPSCALNAGSQVSAKPAPPT